MISSLSPDTESRVVRIGDEAMSRGQSGANPSSRLISMAPRLSTRGKKPVAFMMRQQLAPKGNMTVAQWKFTRKPSRVHPGCLEGDTTI